MKEVLVFWLACVMGLLFGLVFAGHDLPPMTDLLTVMLSIIILVLVSLKMDKH